MDEKELTIITDAEKLSSRCIECDNFKKRKAIADIILQLKKVIREEGLTSLSAPQLGFDKRIFVINFNGDLRAFCNPIVTEVKDITLSRETCPSVPDKTFLVPRYGTISVMYMTPMGKIESKQLQGLAAFTFQHEVDHLEGLLISDIGLEIDSDFDTASEEEQYEIIKMYLDSLDIRLTELNKAIQEDPELKQLSDGIDFMTKVQTGEVKVKYEQIPKDKVKKYELQS